MPFSPRIERTASSKMMYIDTSCLLKLLRGEEESELIALAVERESLIIVSGLTELETLVQLKEGYSGGKYSPAMWRKYEAKLHILRNQEPFHFRQLPSSVWETALRQHRNSGKVHYRSLDRLHLATMERLGLARLMTHDESQAAAARDLGFEVVQPGR